MDTAHEMWVYYFMRICDTQTMIFLFLNFNFNCL